MGTRTWVKVGVFIIGVLPRRVLAGLTAAPRLGHAEGVPNLSNLGRRRRGWRFLPTACLWRLGLILALSHLAGYMFHKHRGHPVYIGRLLVVGTHCQYGCCNMGSR
jgi:hypothetical protein